MRFNAKVGIATAISAAALSGPAIAQACTPGQGQSQGQQGQNQSQQTARFRTDRTGFRFNGRFGRRHRNELAAGSFVSWTANQTGTSSATGLPLYSGSITVNQPAFMSHWHWASMHGTTTTTPNTVTYTFTNAKVAFVRGATNPPAAGDIVKLFGAGFRGSDMRGRNGGTVTIRWIVIRAPLTSTPSS